MRNRLLRNRCLAAGFTLVELLVVIGIVALLISILLPSLQKAQEQARTTQCASNMRQIYLGIQMYAQDHKGFPPQVNGQLESAPDPFFPEGAGGPEAPYPPYGGWVIVLKMGKYVSSDHDYNPYNSSGIFACPTARQLGGHSISGMGGDGMLPYHRTDIGLNNHVSWNPAGYPNRYRWVPLTKIKQSAELYLLGDAIDYYSSINGYTVNLLRTSYFLNESQVHQRHANKSANICFADGHVATLSDRVTFHMPFSPLNGEYRLAWLGWVQ